MSNQSVYSAEGVLLTILAGAGVIWMFARAMVRRRGDLRLQGPLLAAFSIRIICAAALGLTSLGATIRGADEPGFIFDAHYIAGLPFSSGQWLHALTGHLQYLGSGGFISETGTLHIVVMALQIRLFGASVFAMRVTMACASVIGIGLLALAAYELANARAARITAWVLAIEPANVFFSTALHKEPMLYLAEGMVAFGGALLWKRLRVGPVVLMTAGCLIATGTRPYVGWFLGVASALVILHAALRGVSSRTLWAAGLLALVAGVAVISTPAIVQATSKQSLSRLQGSQSANTSDNSNLQLEPINFGSRRAIIENLPRRMFDLMFRPFPWQVGDASQQLGVIETLLVLVAVLLLARALVAGSKLKLLTAAPLLYPALMLLVAYSLAVGNAGTGFRYRTHIIALIVAIVAVLYEHRRAHATEPVSDQPRGLVPASAQ